MGGSWRANRKSPDMKKDSICEELLKSPWSDLAKRLVTKNELRAAGWSEAKIKLHLGKPHGRHLSTHFRNPHGQPYWTGQQVLAAAVRAGVLSSEVKSWPYQSPVHGLTDRGWFILAIAGPHGLVMHPQLQEPLAELAQAKADVVKQAERFTNDLESNVLANTAETFGPMLVREFRLEEKAFPPTIPASECVEKVIWMSGKPKERAEEIRRFTQQQLRLTELQLLASEEEVIEVLAEDIDSTDNRYEMIDTSDLARLCGIEPADGDAERTTYAYWHDLDACDQHHERMGGWSPTSVRPGGSNSSAGLNASRRGNSNSTTLSSPRGSSRSSNYSIIRMGSRIVPIRPSALTISRAAKGYRSTSSSLSAMAAKSKTPAAPIPSTNPTVSTATRTSPTLRPANGLRTSSTNPVSQSRNRPQTHAAGPHPLNRVRPY